MQQVRRISFELTGFLEALEVREQKSESFMSMLLMQGSHGHSYTFVQLFVADERGAVTAVRPLCSAHW